MLLEFYSFIADSVSSFNKMDGCTLTNYNFSSASDVWSYGILMWEMFNPDKPPNYEIPNDAQVIANIVGGKRLEIPCTAMSLEGECKL